MSSLAKHIQVARTQGVEAGLEAYMSAPSSRRHPNFAAITRKRTPETQLAAYCAAFAEKLGQIVPRVPEQQVRADDAMQTIIEQMNAIQARVAALVGNGEVEAVEVEAVEVAREVEFVTAGDAWKRLIELGDDPDFPAPRDMDKPATNGQLYRLNTVYGCVSIA